ncbi:hypothetical protein L798_14897, partial [Zootermopsis nevadensis]
MPLCVRTVTLAAMLLMCSAIHGENEYCVRTTAAILNALQKHFNFGCVIIVWRTDSALLVLKETLVLTQLEKLLVKFGLQTAVVQHESLDFNIQCRHNRPLYVLLSGTRTSLQILLSEARVAQDARWLLFLSNTSLIKEVFSEINVPLNCELLVAQRHDEMVHLSEVYRVHVSYPVEVHRLGSWSRAEGLRWAGGHILQRRGNLRGLRLRAALALACASTAPTFVNNKPVKVGGYFGNIWSTLEETLNFRLEVLTAMSMKISVFWVVALCSLVDVNQRFRGHTASVIRAMSMKISVFWVVAHSVYLSTTHCRVSSAVSADKVRDLNTFSNSSKQIPSRGTNILKCSQKNFQFFKRRQDSTPKSWSCRAVYLTSYLVGVVLLAAYSAALISCITVKRTVLPFQTLQEFSRDETYKFNIAAGGEYSLDNDAKSLYKQRIAPVENSLPSYEEVLNRICAEPRYATILSSSYIESSQAMNRLKCSVTGVYKASFPEYLSMPIAKGCPYYRILNY